MNSHAQPRKRYLHKFNNEPLNFKNFNGLLTHSAIKTYARYLITLCDINICKK